MPGVMGRGGYRGGGQFFYYSQMTGDMHKNHNSTSLVKNLGEHSHVVSSGISVFGLYGSPTLRPVGNISRKW